MEKMGVTIKAESVQNNGNGTFTILLQGRSLVTDELKILRDLIPDRMDQFYDLLAQQALLNSLAEPPPQYDQIAEAIEAKKPQKVKY